MRGFSHALSRLWRARGGNVGMLFAFSALPIIALVGFSVDYGSLVAVKWKVDQATDAAAMAGVTGAQAYLNSYTGASDPSSDVQTAGVNQATAQFKSNLGAMGNVSAPTPSVTVSVNNGVITSQVSVTYTVPTAFMAALGVKTMSAASTATATTTLATYVNLFIVIDNSQSMGIGAQVADQQIIYNASTTQSNFTTSPMTNDRAYGCAMVCHYDGAAAAYWGVTQRAATDLSAIVRAQGAKLRIDVAKSAIASALGSIPAGNVSVAAFTTSYTLVQVYPTPTSGAAWSCKTTDSASATLSTSGTFQNPKHNISAAQGAISTIDLQTNVVFPSGNSGQNSFTYGDGGTSITNALKCLNQQVNALKTAGTAPGNGLTPQTPISYVILVSDGVQNSGRIAQWSANSPPIDYPYYKDTQLPYDFYQINNCSNSSNCKESFAFDMPSLVIQAIDPTACAPLKTLGYKVMTLEIEYIIPPSSLQGSSGSAAYLFPMVGAITGIPTSGGASSSNSAVAQNMQSCATSSSYAYSANSPTDIANAATAMFGTIKQVQAAHITN
jgi:Flp pilus assembly protein TadG